MNALGSFHIRDYARAHMIGQIMVFCRRNHVAFRAYLEGSLDVRLRQITEKIMPS